jgi:hypothetical protein
MQPELVEAGYAVAQVVRLPAAKTLAYFKRPKSS